MSQLSNLHTLVSTFDRNAATLVQKLPASLEPLMSLATAVGEPVVLFTSGAAVALIGLVRKDYKLLQIELLAVAAFCTNVTLKHAVHRARPDTMFVESMKLQSYSFPSGHAFGSTVFYGLLAYLANSRLAAPWSYVVAGLLAVLIVLIGLSRIYLGAHFPSDVVVGWALGLLALVVIIVVIKP